MADTMQDHHAAVGFLPPEYALWQLADGVVGDAVPPLPVLSDPLGETWNDQQTILRVFVQGNCLCVHGEGDASAACHRDLPPDSPEFWKQDHIEIRFLKQDGEALQVILTTDGRIWDSDEHWRRRAIKVDGENTGTAWRVRAAIPLDLFGITPTRGMVAHVRWRNDAPMLSCVSPMELGFPQHDRLAAFRPTPFDPAAPRLLAATERSLTLLNPTDQPLDVTLRQTMERTAGGWVTTSTPHVLPPGQTVLPIALNLPRRPYTRVRWSVVAAGRTHFLAAPTLRADVPLGVPTTPARPRLLLTPVALRQVREKFELPGFARLFARLKPLAEKAVSLSPWPDDDHERLRLVGRAVQQALAAWLIDPTSQPIAAATAAVDKLAGVKLGHSFHLQEGNVCSGMVIAFDAFWPALSPADRLIWQEQLGRYLQLYIATAEARKWETTTIANSNAVSNAGGGLLAMALLGDHPDAPRALRLARKFIPQYLNYNFGPAGGCTEGVQYLDYGLTSLFRFAQCYERLFGDDDGMLAHAAFRSIGDHIRLALCNDGALHGVNDTIPLPMLGELAWFAGDRFGDPLCLWYGDHVLRQLERRRAEGRETPYEPSPIYSFITRPAIDEQTLQPPLATAFALRDIEYATVRSGVNFNCTWVAGLKGAKPPYTHHNQADAGSFYIDYRGERLLIDPGYYKGKATDHCLPIIDGVTPEVPTAHTAAIIDCWSHGNVRLISVDATRAYRGAARQFIRQLLIVGDEAAIVLDDIAPVRDGAEVVSQYQAGGAVELSHDARRCVISGKVARLGMSVFAGDQPCPLDVQPERSLHDTHWGYHFSDCRLIPIHAAYRPAGGLPLLSVFCDADAGLPALRYTQANLLIRLPSGREVRVRREHGWTLEASDAAT